MAQVWVRTHSITSMLHAQWLQNILDRWNKDDKYRKSLSDIGWTEEQIIQYVEIALEDRSYVAKQQERSRNEKSWKLSLNAEGIQRPLNQRSDFQKEAKQTYKRLYHEYTAITGSGNKPIPPQVRQRLGQQFGGLEEHDYRLKASTGWRYYPSSTTHSSSSSRWQPSSDLWSTWSWDSWISSSWTEQSFFLLNFLLYTSLGNRWVRGREGEVCEQCTYRAPLFLMHSCCAVVSQSCCQSVQSHIDPMHLHGSSHEAHCLRFAQKQAHLIAQCRTPCRT